MRYTNSHYIHIHIKTEVYTLATEYFTYVCSDADVSVCSDQRESHIVTKKFEVKQLETNDDDNVDFNRSVSVSEVRWTVSLS